MNFLEAFWSRVNRIGYTDHMCNMVAMIALAIYSYAEAYRDRTNFMREQAQAPK